VWSDTTIDYHIIESYGAFCMQAKALYARTDVGDVASQADYSLPTAFQQLIRCTWDDMTVPQRFETELSNADKNWDTEEGDVIGFTLDTITGLLRKWKIPATTDATKFKVEYYSRGTSLSADATEFDLPVWMVDIIEFRCVAMLLGQESDGQDLEGSGWWMQQWMEGIHKVRTKRRALVRNHTQVMGGASRPQGTPGLAQYPHHYSGPRRVR